MPVFADLLCAGVMKDSSHGGCQQGQREWDRGRQREGRVGEIKKKSGRRKEE